MGFSSDMVVCFGGGVRCVLGLRISVRLADYIIFG